MMTFFFPPACGAAGVFWELAFSVVFADSPAAIAAEVTASPERKSLRFMGPRF